MTQIVLKSVKDFNKRILKLFLTVPHLSVTTFLGFVANLRMLPKVRALLILYLKGLSDLNNSDPILKKCELIINLNA